MWNAPDMDRNKSKNFEQLCDELSLEQIQHAVGGIRHGNVGHDGDMALEHASADHTTADHASTDHDWHGVMDDHLSPAAALADAHHQSVASLFAHSGHTHESAGDHFGKAFEQVTQSLDAAAVKADEALGQAISNHMAGGHHPMTFAWPAHGPLGSIPMGHGPAVPNMAGHDPADHGLKYDGPVSHGPAVLNPHLTDHNAPPTQSSRGRSETSSGVQNGSTSKEG